MGSVPTAEAQVDLQRLAGAMHGVREPAVHGLSGIVPAAEAELVERDAERAQLRGGGS